ncbi:F-box domain-containing protein [Mycena sanguinolenta]|uniref:F-box domain-containing protein n=1 Tax=Mycena sanguinolenta TaxID=230812 RepID=A0A8H6ZCW1_9AGAR|nr:F-box domain-containing protein [Mycena sanguinolenta]
MLSSMQADRLRLLHLEHTISALRAEQAVVQARLDAYKYPVLTLPTEITSEIFINFLPTYPEPPPLKGLASPTMLTHVCRKWREVALATPALWRAIKLGDPDIRHEQVRRISDAWIRRSGSLPLSIVINTNNRDFLHEIFTEPLSMATERWEHLNLWVSLPCLPEIGAPLPMLRSLEFAVSTVGDVFTFYEAPQLRNVILRGRISSFVVLPWMQLTSLTMNYGGVNKIVQILTQTPNLIQCALSLVSTGDTDLDDLSAEGLPDIPLPRLESLVVTDWTFRQTVPGFHLLQSFTVPSLRRLEVHELLLGTDPIYQLESFISNSRCALQEVCIWINDDHTTDDDDTYRSAFPSIPTFSFSTTHDESDSEDED